MFFTVEENINLKVNTSLYVTLILFSLIFVISDSKPSPQRPPQQVQPTPANRPVVVYETQQIYSRPSTESFIIATTQKPVPSLPPSQTAEVINDK
jgi:hypothetical protein